MATDRLRAVLLAMADSPGSPIDRVCGAAVALLSLSGGSCRYKWCNGYVGLELEEVPATAGPRLVG